MGGIILQGFMEDPFKTLQKMNAKWYILKGLIQFILCVVLVMVTAVTWLSNNDQGSIILETLWKITLVNTAGLLLGDFEIYITKRISFAAVAAALVLTAAGVIIALLLENFEQWPIRGVIAYLITVLPPLVVYNGLCYTRGTYEK